MTASTIEFRAFRGTEEPSVHVVSASVRVRQPNIDNVSLGSKNSMVKPNELLQCSWDHIRSEHDGKETPSVSVETVGSINSSNMCTVHGVSRSMEARTYCLGCLHLPCPRTF